MVGRDLNAARSWPTTSTRRSVPGANLAIRVARVTPLKITNSPSVPSYTHGGGIPLLDAPNRPICRCNLTGPAPVGRDDGTRNVQGSTLRNVAAIPPSPPGRDVPAQLESQVKNGPSSADR